MVQLQKMRYSNICSLRHFLSTSFVPTISGYSSDDIWLPQPDSNLCVYREVGGITNFCIIFARNREPKGIANLKLATKMLDIFIRTFKGKCCEENSKSISAPVPDQSQSLSHKIEPEEF